MDEVAVLENPPAKKEKAKRINYTLAATLIAQGATPESICQEVGAKNANVLRVGLHKKGVNIGTLKRINPCAADANSPLVTKVAAMASDILRERLGDTLTDAVNALSSKPVKYSDLLNQGQGHLAGIKTAAEAFKTLYGGADAQVIVFGVSKMRDDPAPVEVEAAVLASDSEQNT